MPNFKYMSFSPRYLVLVNLILLALAAYSASAIFGTALSVKMSEAPKVVLSEPPPPVPPQSSRPPSYYALIHKRDIFNSEKPVEAVVAEDQKEEVITNLKLKLWGVALRQNNRDSYCIIEEEKKRVQGVYKVGEEVPGGATVKEVEWDRVILTRAGSDEILEIEDTSTGSGGKRRSSSSSSSSRFSSSGRKRGSKPAMEPVKGVEVVSDSEYIVEREEVDNALENMSQLFTQIRAVPHFEGGESVGFRLFAIRRGSLFDKIGLKNGDIVRSINGQVMNDPTRALGLLEELRDSTDLSVAITRNRKEKSISYTVR